MKEFIFEQKERNKEEVWDDRVIALKRHLYALREECKQDFSVVIDKYSPKRTQPQLKGYFKLINICREYMQKQGNNFTQNEVDTYFRIKSGHYSLMDGVKIPKSISNRSDTTTQEMGALISCVVEFGVDNYIKDCFLEPTALREMLNYYKGN